MRLFSILIASTLLIGVLAACGDDDDEGSSPTPTAGVPTVPTSLPQPEPAQPVDSEAVSPTGGVIEIAAEGNLFVDNHLAVPLGESVVIRLTNNDTVPHNLRLAGTDGEWVTEDDAVTAPEQIDGGGVGELTFAPPVDGYYTFRCDFHPASMGGRIVAGDPSGPPVTIATPTPSPTTTAADGSPTDEASETQ
jgi:plastocyanin